MKNSSDYQNMVDACFFWYYKYFSDYSSNWPEDNDANYNVEDQLKSLFDSKDNRNWASEFLRQMFVALLRDVRKADRVYHVVTDQPIGMFAYIHQQSR